MYIYNLLCCISHCVFIIGKFGIVYKASYTSKEGTKIEVAVKTVKCMYKIQLATCFYLGFDYLCFM